MLGRAASAMLVAGLVAAGCGDDKPASDAPTKADYIARVDRICAGAEPEGKTLQARFSALRTRDEATVRREAPRILREIVAYARRLLARVRAVPRPADAAGAVAYYDAVEVEMGTLETYARAIASGDRARTQALGQRVGRGALRTRGLAARYGFEECGSGD